MQKRKDKGEGKGQDTSARDQKIRELKEKKGKYSLRGHSCPCVPSFLSLVLSLYPSFFILLSLSLCLYPYNIIYDRTLIIMSIFVRTSFRDED